MCYTGFNHCYTGPNMCYTGFNHCYTGPNHCYTGPNTCYTGPTIILYTVVLFSMNTLVGDRHDIQLVYRS